MADDLELPPADLPADAPTPTEPEPAIAEPPTFEIAPLWRRVIGGLIDITVLIGTCLALTPLFWLFAYPIGARWGRLIGFMLGVMYLGLANSSLTRGRTLGKLITGTRTVSEDGKPLRLITALARGTFMSLIFVPDFLYIGGLDTASWFFAIGGFLGLLYGLLFNRQTRQTPYDFFGMSYVVRANQPADAVQPPRRKIHERVPSILLALFLIPGLCGPSVIGLKMTSGMTVNGVFLGEQNNANRNRLLELTHEVERTPPFTDAGIATQHITQTSSEGVVSFDILILNAVSSEKCGTFIEDNPCLEQAEALAHQLYEAYPPAATYDIVQGRVINRIDLGWFQSHTTMRYGLDPDDMDE